MQTSGLPAAEVTRPRTFMVGALLGTSATAVAFLALIAIYVQQRQVARSSDEVWFPEGSIELGPAGMMMMTLVLSVVTVQWAVQAARDSDRSHGFMALGTTLLFGAAVLNQFWFMYQDTGYAIDAGQAQLLFYVVTGSFIAMLVAAMAFVIVATLRSLIGQFDREQSHIVQAAAIFWHTTVFCYFLVWYVVFIFK